MNELVPPFIVFLKLYFLSIVSFYSKKRPFKDQSSFNDILSILSLKEECIEGEEVKSFNHFRLNKKVSLWAKKGHCAHKQYQ